MLCRAARFKGLIADDLMLKKGNHKGCPYAWFDGRDNPCGCPKLRANRVLDLIFVLLPASLKKRCRKTT